MAVPLPGTPRLQARSAQVAATLAASEERLAATLDRLATDHPHRADRLRGLAEAARQQAAQERGWLNKR